jgi:glycosyltransferase involved in cell wall biosynthesis
MRVTFVLPGANLGGGTRVVADYARALAVRGHQVTVAWPKRIRPALRSRVRNVLRGKSPLSALWKESVQNLTHFHRVSGNLRIVEGESGGLLPTDLPDADVLIGTWWTTLEMIAEFPERLGRKTHLAQGDDRVTPGLQQDRVCRAWGHPWPKIAVAPWLEGPVRETAGDVPLYVVLNGVDLSLFHAPPRGRHPAPTVGLTYSPLHIKGMDIAIETLSIARSRNPGLRVVAFGTERSAEFPLPSFVDLTLSPPQDRLRELYASADWWLWTSRVEGFGLPLLEAMACRTPVIATRAGAAPDLLQGGGGQLVESHSPKDLAEALLERLEEPVDRWRAYSDAALSTAMRRSLEAAVSEFEEALEAIVAGEGHRPAEPARARGESAVAVRGAGVTSPDPVERT